MGLLGRMKCALLGGGRQPDLVVSSLMLASKKASFLGCKDSYIEFQKISSYKELENIYFLKIDNETLLPLTFFFFLVALNILYML